MAQQVWPMLNRAAVQIGAVYFRQSNPPREDWARDYAVAAKDGHTMFRHWFPWNAIEVAPGVFDWTDFDRQLDLAAEHGINTVIGEISTDYPEWLYHQHPHARRENRQGIQRYSEMHVSCVTGGHQSLCLDNPEVAEACARFLTELARRYRDHPALYGYDVWNECTYYHPDNLCYCPATQARFREWLRSRYGDLEALKRAWHRHSLTGWEQIEMSRQVASFPDVYDRIAFHNDNAFEWMQWKADLLRAADPDHPIIAHGNAKSFVDIAPAAGDDFRAAEMVDVFGYTYWRGNACHPFLAGDLIRSASRGRRFWRAEGVGDSDWLGRNTVGQPQPEHDRMHDPQNIRLDILISLACGASGFLNPRWRPLLDGPLFGAFGWYAMDGSRTERSEMVASLARWANDPALAALWAAQPVRGQVALLLSETSQANCYARHGSADLYSFCVQGAYEAFLAANVQCDFVRLDHMDDYPLLYAPFPVALEDKAIDRLRRWVEGGGCLVSEGCPGYFDPHGHAFARQPSRGLDALLGCRERSVAFAPDMYERLSIRTRAGSLLASLYRQTYEPTTGTAVGWYEGGEVAMVEHRAGKGRTLLVGAMPGYACKRLVDAASREWYASLLAWAGRTPWVQVDTPGIVARLWQGEGAAFLWLVNQQAEAMPVSAVVHEDAGSFSRAKALRGPHEIDLQDRQVRASVPG